MCAMAHTNHAVPLLHAFQLLSWKERACAALVCREWHQIQQSPSLWTVLDLRGCQDPEPALRHLESSKAGMEALRVVDLEFAVGIEDRHLQLLARAPLEEINLNSCQRLTDNGVAAVVRACPHLRSLSLYWNLNIGLATLTALAECCPMLERINLSGCKAVTDLAVERLARGCTQLTHVDLTRCVRLGDSAYEALAAHCPAVRELRLYASMPSAKALQGLAALRQLQVIDLCGAHGVTDGAVAALGACQDLREVNLTWCVQLTDKGIAALARGCHGLEVLSLHGLRGVTDASIAALAQGCASTLRTLDTSGCLGIREHDRARLRQLFPALRCFVVHK